MTDNATAASIAVLMVGFCGALGAAFWSAPRVPAAEPSRKPVPHYEATNDPTVTREDALVALDGARAAASRATGTPVFANRYWFLTKGLPE